METDLLVIGGGPAGLSAAIEASSNGVKTTIADESLSFGGQLRQQTQFLNHLPQHYQEDRGVFLRDKLIERLNTLDVDWLPYHVFVGIYQDGRIGLSDGDRVVPVQAKKLILTPGAAEEPVLFPGWTLPGVMTIGAAQILMNHERVLPGNNAVIMGSNDFALEVIQQLSDVGVNIKGVVEPASKVNPRNDNSKNIIKEMGIPLLPNSEIIRASGAGKVERVYIEQNGEEINLDVDLVGIGGGLTPILEPFEILNCEMEYKRRLGGWLPKYNAEFETSRPSVYIAGNAAGITGIGSILITGEMAGLSVTESLGAIKEPLAEKKKQYLWSELYRLESGNVFEARLSLIRNFSNGALPKQLHFLTEG